MNKFEDIIFSIKKDIESNIYEIIDTISHIEKRNNTILKGNSFQYSLLLELLKQERNSNLDIVNNIQSIIQVNYDQY